MGIFGPTDLLFSYTAGGSLNDATFSRASIATYRDRTGTISTASSTGVTRLQWYDVDSDGGWEQPALLLEGSRTNSFTFSEDYSQGAWTKKNVTVSTNATTAPDGSTTADKLVETSSTKSAHQISRGLSLSTNQRTSLSIFAKAAERKWILLRTTNHAGTDLETWFNVLDGTVGTQSSGHSQAVIEEYRDGWYRVGVVFDSSSGTGSIAFGYQLASTDNVSQYDGSTTDGAFFWGAQVEANDPYQTSYIPTTNASVTRSADSVKYPLRFGLQDFTVYAKVQRPLFADSTGLTSNPGIVQLSTSNPITELRFGLNGTLVQSIIRNATSNVNVTSSMPSADPSEIVAQYRNFSTGAQTRVDSGGGFSTWSGSLGAVAEFGSTNLVVGDDPFGGIELDSGIANIKISKGLKTLAQMRDLRADR